MATFAKRGPFSVLRADRAPLGEAGLDDEGRCLMTDHGAFVLFNVYAPNASGGTRMGYKLRWMAALRAAMVRERASGKPASFHMLLSCQTPWRPPAVCARSAQTIVPQRPPTRYCLEVVLNMDFANGDVALR